MKCSEISKSSSEQIFGTAPRVNNWLLIEYSNEWEENILNSINLSSNIKAKISELLRIKDYTRLQWIKNMHSGNGISLYFVESTEQCKNIFKKTLSAYDEIVNLEPKRFLTPEFSSNKPLVLICTHKSYDLCCGDIGHKLYSEMIDNENEFDVWETTHLGGHRFAANIMILPDGIYYGRIGKAEYELIRNDYFNNRITIGNLRGRCYYDKYTQAAEYYLRSTTGNYSLDSLRHISSSTYDNLIMSIEFADNITRANYNVLIEEKPDSIEIYSGCTDERKKSIPQYRLLGID